MKKQTFSYFKTINVFYRLLFKNVVLLLKYFKGKYEFRHIKHDGQSPRNAGKYAKNP